MGARQSKRSVDITTTPKKDGATPSDGSVAGDSAAPGDGKLERIEETDGKPITNGTANNHPDSSNNDEKDSKDKEQEKGKDKDKDKDEDTEKDHDNSAEETTRPESKTEAVVLAEEATTPTESQPPTSPDAATSPESKDTKKKEKKKWSFRSLSFGKRDRSKTTREGGTPKNGDVAKTEPLAEGGEEAEAVLQSVDETVVENKPELVVDDVAVSGVTSSSTVESESNPVVPDEIATFASEESTGMIKEKEAPPTSPPPAIPGESNEASLNLNNENNAKKVEPTIEEQPEAKEKIKEETEKKEKEKETATVVVVPPVVAQNDDENKEEKEEEEEAAAATTTTTLVESGVEQHQAAATTIKTEEEGKEEKEEEATTTTTKGVILLDNTEVSQSNHWLVKTGSESETPSSTTSQAQAQAKVENKSANVQADCEADVKSSPHYIVEMKTSEELPTPPPLPSSPPPTPIEPSYLEHAAASASALAEALKLPAEAAANVVIDLAAKNNFKTASNDGGAVVDNHPIKDKGYEKSLKENQMQQQNIVSNEKFSSHSSSFLSSSSSSCQLPSNVYSFSRDLVKGDEEGESNDCKVVREVEGNCYGKEEERNIVNEDEGKEDRERTNNFFNNDNDIKTQPDNFIADVLSFDSISKESHSHIENGEKEEEKEEADSVIVEAKPALVVNEDNNIEASKVIEKFEEEGEKERRDDDDDDKNEKKKEEEEEEEEKEKEEEEIVPPLPESPIPNFDKTVITKELDSEAVFDPIEELRASHFAAEGNAAAAAGVFRDVGSNVCNSSPPTSSSSSSSFIIEEKKASRVVEDRDQDDDDRSPALLKKDILYSEEFESLPKINDKIMKTESEVLFATTNGDELSNCDIIKSNLNDILDIDNVVNSSKNSDKFLLEFDNNISVNGSSDNGDYDGVEKNIESVSSLIRKNEDRESSNEEFEVESISQSLHSYKDSDDCILKDRLIDYSDEIFDGKNNYDDKGKNDDDHVDDDTTTTATTTNCSLTLIEYSNTTLSDNNTSTTNDLLKDNYHDHQKIAEPESVAASVENEAEISTTESVTETPASPAPPAPVVELPILQPSEPAITEDVASVTKAIEENDISDKAVAAAVNEAIESVNANDLVNDSLHQNIIKE